MVIGVLVELSNKNIDKVFDYLVPDEMVNDIKIGIRVEVPFGRQILEGFVLEIKDKSDLELKYILGVKDYDVILNEELFLEGKLKIEAYFTLTHKTLCVNEDMSKTKVKEIDGFKKTAKSLHFVLIGQLGKFVLDN